MGSTKSTNLLRVSRLAVSLALLTVGLALLAIVLLLAVALTVLVLLAVALLLAVAWLLALLLLSVAASASVVILRRHCDGDVWV